MLKLFKNISLFFSGKIIEIVLGISIIIIVIFAFISYPIKNNYVIYDTSQFYKSIENNKININVADWVTLTMLNGIGEAKAKEIIKYREENGGFDSIYEIKEVKGIGDKLFDSIKQNITI